MRTLHVAAPKLAALGLAALSLLPIQTPAHANSPGSNPKWSQQMVALFGNLQELMVMAVDPAKFKDPKNAAQITEMSKNLARAAHSVDRMKAASPDLDPSISILASVMKDQTTQAAEAFEAGHKDYARNLVKSLAGTCIACHSRVSTGSKLDWNFETGFARGLPLMQQAELLAAGRSFDAALKTLEKVITNNEVAKRRPYEWNRALRSALALSIRMEQDPVRAKSLVEKAMKLEGAPQFTRMDAKQWIKSLDDWKAENLPGISLTEDELFKEARRLLAQAQGAQKFPLDRGGDVAYLRATAVLHRMLQVAPSGVHSAEGLYLLGNAYAVLRDFDLYGLNDLYYQACIQRAPGTETAQACFRQYEESVIAGYSGSSGTDIPSSVRKHLRELEKLARPKLN